MRSTSIFAVAAMAAGLAASMPGGAEVVPRDMLSGEPLFPRPTPATFGGSSSRSRIKGRSKPSGSKLARKAARGKL